MRELDLAGDERDVALLQDCVDPLNPCEEVMIPISLIEGNVE